jgi:hypothetical protein
VKKTIFIFLFYFNQLELNAQIWTDLNSGLDGPIYALYSDSITNKLYIGGAFTEVDQKQSKFIATWDGNSWDTLGGGMEGAGPVYSIQSFKDTIYVGGYFRRSFTNGIGKTTNGLAKWNGNSWDSIGSGFHPSGGPREMIVNNDTLYLAGSFDSVGTIHSQSIVAFDGYNYIPIGIPGNSTGGAAASCVFFNGELFLGGNFQDSSILIYNFAKRSSNHWINLCSSSGCGFFDAMCVYNNELYVTGINFVGPAMHIMRYDGSNYFSVGGDLDWRGWTLKVINNLLFAVGGFDNAGGQQASKIAIWNGTSWAPFSNDIFDGDITDIAIFQNDLYVAGGFTHINTANINRIAKFPNYMQHVNSVLHTNVKIYPNPSNGSFRVDLQNLNFRKPFIIKIINMMSEIVYFSRVMSTQDYLDFNLNKYSPGMYYISFSNDDLDYASKFVIEK